MRKQSDMTEIEGGVSKKGNATLVSYCTLDIMFTDKKIS
jgi:hypothetical protein